MKDSFLIYKSFYKPISRLSDKQLGRLFRAIFKYQLGEEVTVKPNLDETKYTWGEIKVQIVIGRKGDGGGTTGTDGTGTASGSTTGGTTSGDTGTGGSSSAGTSSGSTSSGNTGNNGSDSSSH